MTDDENSLLKYICKHSKRKMIVVINKVDELKKNESIADCVKSFYDDLKSQNVYPEAVIPVSVLGYEVLKNKMDEEYEYFYRKFKKEEYSLPKYVLSCNRNVDAIGKERVGIRNNTGITFLRTAICKVLIDK